eukprot:2462666-Rhodomonas_salina.1
MKLTLHSGCGRQDGRFMAGGPKKPYQCHRIQNCITSGASRQRGLGACAIRFSSVTSPAARRVNAVEEHGPRPPEPSRDGGVDEFMLERNEGGQSSKCGTQDVLA